MRKSGLSILMVVVILAAVMVNAASAAPSVSAAPAAGPRVTFTKTASNPAPRVGEVFTYTLSFNTVPEEPLPIRVNVADVNPDPRYLKIIPTSVTGGATYNPMMVAGMPIEGIVWTGMLLPAAGSPQVVTFQVRVTGIPDVVPQTGYPITNRAYMSDVTATGSLPGSLPLMAAETQVNVMWRVPFTKTVSDPTPQVGEIVLFTLTFNTTAAETLPIQVRMSDPNPAPQYLQILPGTITGGAVYSPTLGGPAVDGIAWEGLLQPAAGELHTITFQAKVTNMPTAATKTGYPITNTAYLVDAVHPGSLPLEVATAEFRLMPQITFLPFLTWISGK